MAAAEPLAKTMADPMVVVDDLHVVYRVFGSKSDKGTAATALWRMLRRQRRPSVREVHAIRGVSFVANRGDAVGVIGRNGSGKSTLLRAIAGLLPPEQGAVYTTGHASLLGVNAALLDDLTGERNVVVCGLAMGMTPREVKDKYQSIVDFSGVGDFINLPMRTYSTGMGSRLRFAIASAKQPRGAAHRRGAGHRGRGVPASGAASGSRNSARRPAPCSSSPTAWRRSRRPVTA